MSTLQQHLLAPVIRLQSRGEHAEALSLVERLLQQGNPHPQLIAVAASLLLFQNGSEDASTFLEASSADKSSLSTLMLLAACAHRQGNRSTAIDLYQRVLSLHPSHQGARAALAVLSASGFQASLELELQRVLDAQDLATALSISHQLRSLPGAEPWTLLRHAHLLRQLGRAREALAALDQCFPDPAFQAHVLKNRGEILRDLGDLHAALAALQEAVHLDPTCPDHAIALGFLHAEVGAFDQGLDLLHQAERLIPSADHPAERWLRLLQVYLLHRRGDYETALAIAQGLTADPELGFEARLQVAGLLIRIGDPKARSALDALSPADPRQEREALRLRVDWLLSGFELLAALQLLEPLLAAEPLDIATAEQACLLQVLLLDLDAARGLYLRLRKAKQASGDRALQRASRAGLHRGIYEEFNSNHHLAQRIRQLLDLPPAERLQPLAALLAQEPESHATAHALLLSARHGGRLDPWSAAPAGSDSIPRRVMQLWLGEELPESVLVTAGTWQQANPGYEHQLFRATDADTFLAEHATPRVQQAYAKAASPLLRADLFQLAYLHLRGGLTARLNVRCRHSLDPWLAEGIDVLLFQRSDGFLGSDVLASSPGQPLIEAMLDLACFLVLGQQGSNPWFLTGPGMLSLCFARYYREGLADPQAPPPPGMCLLSHAQISQRLSVDLAWPVRIQNGTWSDPGQQLSGGGPVFRSGRRRRPRPRPRPQG
jgi:mannosyltransferase OCH1-like enzyme/tetratricopeptide (TPR) repeat protein